MLGLEGNELTELDQSVSVLGDLETLDISSNELTKVPDCIRQLSNLTSLDISHNEIEEIPAWVEDLKLDEFSYQGNASNNKVPDSIHERFNQDEEDYESDDDFSSLDEKLERVKLMLDQAESMGSFDSMSMYNNLKIWGILLGVLSLVIIGIMITAAYTTGSIKFFMVVSYYIVYSAFMTSSIMLENASLIMLKGMDMKVPSLTRRVVIHSISAAMSVVFHWLFFWG